MHIVRTTITDLKITEGTRKLGKIKHSLKKILIIPNQRRNKAYRKLSIL